MGEGEIKALEVGGALEEGFDEYIVEWCLAQFQGAKVWELSTPIPVDNGREIGDSVPELEERAISLIQGWFRTDVNRCLNSDTHTQFGIPAAFNTSNCLHWTRSGARDTAGTVV